MGCVPTREDDEMALRWLWLRSVDGWSSGEIAARYGVTSERVRTTIQRIRIADREESGEQVEEAYW
jgi:DNA-directed RNA polymerase specialized sigma24 family protein